MFFLLVSVKPDKRERIFVCRLFDNFFLLSALMLTSRENIWYFVIIIRFKYLVIILGLESYNYYFVPAIFSLLVSVKPDTKEKIFVCHVLDMGIVSESNP